MRRSSSPRSLALACAASARLVAASVLLSLGGTSTAWTEPFELSRATIAEINAAFDAGLLSSEKLVDL